MSLSFGSSKKKTSSSQETDPWEPTIQPLEDLVGQIGQYSGNVGASGNQEDAFAQLFQNAQGGNPYAGDIHNLAADLFAGVPSQSGTVTDAYKRITDQLGPTASGANLDVNENPYLQKLMQTVGDDIQNRIGAQFAGAGRDITGNAQGQKALAKGISEGTLPTLFNQYNLERQNQSDAAKTLFGAGTQTGTTVQGLDTAALLDRIKGIDVGNAAIDAENYGPNTILQLEQQLKQLPIEDLGRIEALLGPIAQLGGQMSGQSTTKGSSMGLGVSNLFGGLGSLLSDEDAKEGVDGGEPEKVGELADGTPIYKYVYKGDPSHTAQIGVMAQQVEGRHPEAVTRGPDGMRRVNYDLATEEAEAIEARKRKKGRG